MASSAPLLTTKLFIPPARPNLVSRPRLHMRLRAGLSGKLTLIAAPAGFGKTTLLADWLTQRQKVKGKRQNNEANEDDDLLPFTFSPLPFQVAWLSLDAGDSDPVRFWSYVITALERILPGIGVEPLEMLQSPQPPPIEVVLTTLLNGLAGQGSGIRDQGSDNRRATSPDPWPLSPDPYILVLDDYHTIDAPAIHQALAVLIDYLPPRLHVMITTRVDPPLPLARWRARGALSELRATDLRFTPAEATTFLVESMELPLEPADVLALDARTEGWVAGLQLAGLAMRDHDDRAGFISAFAGSNRFVVDYLVEEVFARQPAHIQRFLLQTAILDRLCGPLCDAVLGLTNDQGNNSSFVGRRSPALSGSEGSFVEPHSQLILEQLERANIFTIALDDQRRWYRYHHLFADVLRQRLAHDAFAADLATLHRRAGAWYEQEGLGSEAVRHMLAAHEWERAAEIIERIASSVAHRGQVQTVIGWLDALPETLVRARPFLSVYRAGMLMYTNRLEAAEASLQEAEESVAISLTSEQAQLALGRIAQTRAAIRRFAGDLAGAVACARQALELLPEAAASWRAVAAMTAAHAYLVSGDVTPASEQLVEGTIGPVRASGNLFAAITAAINLARLQMLQGRLRAAATTCESLIGATSQAEGLRALVGGASYYFVMGDILRERDELDAAEDHLTRGAELAAGALAADADVIALGYIALARLVQARGDHNRALATLDAFEQLARQRHFFARLPARSSAARARLQLAQGDLTAASRWAEAQDQSSAGDVERSTAPPFGYEYEALTLTRIYIAQGRADAALRLLDRLLADAQANARAASAIEIQLLLALALHAQGKLPAALAALEQALAPAEQQGYIRIFADEGAPMVALLREALRQGIAPEYVGQLLDAFPEPKETSRQADKQTGNNSSALVSRSPGLPVPVSLVEPLSARELEVLRLVAAGLSNQAIAEQLIVTLGTVKKHLNNGYAKLGVNSRTQAVARARELELL